MAAQVERSPPVVHRLSDRAHVGVGVPIEKLEEEREVLRVPLMWRRGQQQHVVRRVPQQLTQPVTLTLVRLVAGRHPVRLVYDDEVPVRLAQSRQDVLALGQIERGHHLRLLHPLVHAELGAQVAALHHQERLVELLLQFPLPLEREIRRGDDQDAFGKAPQLQLAEQQTGHDRLACPSIVSQQESHARQLQQVVVNRLQLVRQRVDARDRQPEIRIEFPRESERVGLKSQSEQLSVAVVSETTVKNCQSGQFSGSERDPPESLRLRTDQTERPVAQPRLRGCLHAHRLVEKRAGQDLAFGRDRRGFHGKR